VTTFRLPLRQSTTFPDRSGFFSSPAVLKIGDNRFRFGYVSPDGTTRRVDDGPELPGPYAYADPWMSTGHESKRLRELGAEDDADFYDLVQLGEHTFRIVPAPNDNIRLVLVDPKLDPNRPQAGDVLNGRIKVVRVLDEHEDGRPVVMAQWLNASGDAGMEHRYVVRAGTEISYRPPTDAAFTVTRMSIGRQISEALHALGIPEIRRDLRYLINDKILSPGEAADYLLDGGFQGAFGRDRMVLHPDRLAERGDRELLDPTDRMTRTEAYTALNRMGHSYDKADVEEVMSGDRWVPRTEAEWTRYRSERWPES
jgi:hypothetical protein